MPQPTLIEASPFSQDGVSNPVTDTVNCVGANLLVVDVTWRPGDPDDRTITAITFNGDALSLWDTQATVGSPPTIRMQRYYLLNPDQVNGTLSITFSASGTQVVGLARSYSGVDPAAPLGTMVKDTGESGALITHNVTGVVASQLVTDFVGMTTINGNTSSTLSAGAGQTDQQNAAPGANCRGAGSTESGVGSITMSWTPAFSDEGYAHFSGTINGLPDGVAVAWLQA